MIPFNPDINFIAKIITILAIVSHSVGLSHNQPNQISLQITDFVACSPFNQFDYCQKVFCLVNSTIGASSVYLLSNIHVSF